MTMHYYLRDHEGNVRVVTDGDGKVEQVNHYYPFGGLMGMSTGSSVQPYKYNGKELDRSNGLDLYDYGARWYDAALGRWLSMDPHGESYQQTSPFAYCKNDPVNAIDPDGRDFYYTQDGQFAFKNTAETDNIYIISKYEYGKELENGNWLVSVWNRQSIADSDLSPEAYSNIFTDVINRMDEVDTKGLTDGRISVMVWHEDSKSNLGVYGEGCNNANNAMGTLSDIREINGEKNVTAYIYPKGTSERNIFTTESNIQNLVGVHEILGHGMLGLKHDGMKPDKLFHLQKTHRTWGKTTIGFKIYETEIYGK